MKIIVCLLVIFLALIVSVTGCSNKAAPTSKPESTSPSDTPVSTSANPNPVAVTTPIARPSAGKSQEITLNLKATADTYSLVIFLEKGEMFDLDWKFVSNPQVGIKIMFTTPEGREMDSKVQPLNLPGHPLYDKNSPSQKLEELVGSHLVINVGQDKYCDAGYYTLVIFRNPAQSGTVYLRYNIDQIPAQ
jgi:hypothetical protein